MGIKVSIWESFKSYELLSTCLQFMATSYDMIYNTKLIRLKLFRKTQLAHTDRTDIRRGETRESGATGCTVVESTRNKTNVRNQTEHTNEIYNLTAEFLISS